jgi:SAM-dependent methyltransferase
MTAATGDGQEAALRCVRCGASPLDGVATGYRCPSCGAAFPVVNCVARFVGSELYTGAFGFQWKRFARTQLDSANGTTRSRDTFVEKTGWAPAALRGASVLDAGCGMGRFAEICVEAGADVHAVDLSVAVEAARANLGHRPGIRFYQADILELPFVENSFDFIYSIGVLDHTPSTREAFLRLCPLLKPGGRIAIWVYSSDPPPPLSSRLLRTVTPRFPSRLLLGLCWLAVPLYYLHRLPVIGPYSVRLLYTGMDDRAEWRWLSTFDWYAPRYKWTQSWDEVEGWFREAGLEAIERGSFPVSVRGRRPVSQAGPLQPGDHRASVAGPPPDANDS